MQPVLRTSWFCASRRHNQTGRVGAAPTCRTIFKFLRGRHRKGTDFVNRTMWAQIPPEDPFQHTLHSVTAAFFVVNEAVPGQNRLREPFNSCARQRAESAVRKTALPSASLGRTSIFSSDTREPAVLAWFGTKTRPGQHRGIRPFSLVCSLRVERRAHNPEGAGAMPAGPTISKIAL